MLRLLRHVSWRQWQASRSRTLLVVVGIALGVALIVAIQVLDDSILRNFRATLESLAGPADLEVTLGIGELGFDEGALETVRADPDVASAVGLVRGTVALADDPTDALQLFGTDLTAEDDLQRYHVRTTIDRRTLLRAIEDAHAIFLAATFADEHRLAEGMPVTLSTPTGIHTLTIRGLLAPDGVAAALGGHVVFMDVIAAQGLLGKIGRLDQVDIVLRSGASPDVVGRRLEAALPRGLSVAPPTRRGLQYAQVLASIRMTLTNISALCLLAGIFIVFNTTMTGAAHRAASLAGLQLIGAEPGTLFRLLMIEALVLGVVGTALGILYGLGLAWLLAGMMSDAFGTMMQLRFPMVRLSIDPLTCAVIALVGIAAALFASWFAARAVMRREPLSIVHRAGFRHDTTTIARRLFVVWALAFVSSVAAFAVEVRLKSSAWGNAGSLLWNGAIMASAVPLLTAIAPSLRRCLRRAFGLTGEVAADGMLRFQVRTGMTVAAMALVLALSISLATLVSSFRFSLTDYLRGTVAGDAVVSGVTTEGGWLEAPIEAAVGDELSRIPGVRHVDTLRVVPGQSFRGLRIALTVWDGEILHRLPSSWYTEGNPDDARAAMEAGTGVSISRSLADRASMHVGDRVVLDSPTGSVEMPIVGVLPDYMSDRGSVIMSPRLFVERWQDPSVSRFVVALDPALSLERFREDVQARLGSRYRLKVDSSEQAIAYIIAKVERAFAFTDSIQLLIAIVTVAGIFDLLLSGILERRRELALWRLVGAADARVRRAIVIESATIGALGAALGLVIGYVSARLWVAINYRYMFGFFVDFRLATTSVLLSMAVVVLMAMLAGYAAARYATRQPVLEGLATSE